MAPEEAVRAPRLHHQWQPDEIFVEPQALSQETTTRLEGMGYHITEQRPWGGLELIAVGPLPTSGSTASASNKAEAPSENSTRLYYGVSDPRQPSGAAVGYR
jgi:gamma-glutamyltranspeptidase/glutathione hydrolase